MTETPTSLKNISPALKSDCDLISQWFINKLNEGSATSGLMLVTMGEVKTAHSYGLDTVQEAIDLARKNLISDYKDAVSYVIAYDAGWYNSSGIEQRAIFLEAEEKITPSPRTFAYRMLPVDCGPFSFTNEIFERKPPNWSLYTA